MIDPLNESIGILAAILTTSAFIPQVYKIYKEKKAQGVSLTMYLIMLIILPGTTITFFGLLFFKIDIVLSLDKTIFSIS